jgi:hypothetical protein
MPSGTSKGGHDKFLKRNRFYNKKRKDMRLIQKKLKSRLWFFLPNFKDAIPYRRPLHWKAGWDFAF